MTTATRRPISQVATSWGTPWVACRLPPDVGARRPCAAMPLQNCRASKATWVHQGRGMQGTSGKAVQRGGRREAVGGGGREWAFLQAHTTCARWHAWPAGWRHGCQAAREKWRRGLWRGRDACGREGEGATGTRGRTRVRATANRRGSAVTHRHPCPQHTTRARGLSPDHFGHF